MFCVEMCSSVSTPVCEPLSWSCTELPSEGQTVALLASVVENPGEFFCRIDNPTGIGVQSREPLLLFVDKIKRSIG